MPKILYMLIGPKGSGKTHIGMLVNRSTGIRFVRVETLWLSLQPGEVGWKKVEAAIDELFQEHDRVMIESLGIGEGFRTFHASLSKKYVLRMIRVHAALDTCLERVRQRNRLEHIPVSDEKVMEYNQAAAEASYDWVLEIDNNQPLSNEELLRAIWSIEA